MCKQSWISAAVSRRTIERAMRCDMYSLTICMPRQVDVAAGREGVKISASCAYVAIVICVMAVKLTGANRVILREVCDYTDSKT